MKMQGSKKDITRTRRQGVLHKEEERFSLQNKEIDGVYNSTITALLMWRTKNCANYSFGPSSFNHALNSVLYFSLKSFNFLNHYNTI